MATPDELLLELIGTPEGKADPYPLYAALHETAPRFRSALGDAFVCSRYDDCNLVLRDARFGKDNFSLRERAGLTDAQLERWPAFAEERRSMLFMNPPDHTRNRGLVSKAFTPKAVEALRPAVVRLVDELLDGMRPDASGAAEVDVMTALAFPLPVTVVGEMLGVPPADRPPFQDLVRATNATLEATMTDDVLDEAHAATLTMDGYFRNLVAERRMSPQDDLVTSLLAAQDEGDQLSDREIVGTAVLLFAAGFETTTNLIGNGLLALLRRPDQLQRLRDDPTLVRSAVEELLRYDAPVQIDARTAFEDVEIGGEVVEAGQMVVTLIGAANHDPTHYRDPAVLDLARSEGPPLSFGAGIHFCLGAALARLEGQVVFTRLLERFDSIELVEPDPPYRPGLTLRGLDRLLVALR